MNLVVFMLLLLLSSAFGEETTTNTTKPKSKNRMPRGKRQLIYVPYLQNPNFYAQSTVPSIMTPKMIFQSKIFFPQAGFTNAPSGQATIPSQLHGLPVTPAFTMIPNLSIEGLGNMLLGHGPNIQNTPIGNMMGIRVLNSGPAFSSGITVTAGHSPNNVQTVEQIVGAVPFMNIPASYTNSQPLTGVQNLSGHLLNGQVLANQPMDGHSINQEAVYNGLGGRSLDGHLAATGLHPYGVISQIMHATPYMK